MHSHMTTPRSLITSFPHMATCSEQHRKIRRECSHAAQTIPCRVARHAMISSNRPSLNNRGDYRPPLNNQVERNRLVFRSKLSLSETMLVWVEMPPDVHKFFLFSEHMPKKERRLLRRCKSVQ